MDQAPHWMRLAHIVPLLVLSAAFGEEWTRFRGPNGSGVSQDAGYPLHVGKQNLIWRVPTRPGKSSPVLTRTRVFITGFEGDRLFTQCFDRSTGKLMWERVERRTHEEDVQPLNNPAAITPVTDGENVYAFFKDFGIVSYDAAGKLRWRVPLGPFTNSMGLGASPILVGDVVVLVVDQMADSYITAIDRRNGRVRWRVAREESHAWATPIVYGSSDAPIVITAGFGHLAGHRLADGKRVFGQPGLAAGMVASPVLAERTVFAFGYGYESSAPYEQVRTKWDNNRDGQISPDEYTNQDAVLAAVGRYLGNRDGIVTKEEWDLWEKHVKSGTNLVAVRLNSEPDSKQSGVATASEIWRHDKGFVGVVPSPIVYDGVLYVVKNGGILTAFDAISGKVLKAGRVQGAIGGYSASPVAADGNIFLASEEGHLAVIRAGRDWDVTAVSDLGEGIYATPALSQGRIYVRTTDALYCFGSDSRQR